MHELAKLLLFIVAGAAAITLAVAVGARLLTEERRLGRAFRKGLRARPDAVLIAHGAGRGVALSLAAQRIVTAWDHGGWRMDYPLDELMGAELDLDGEVAARAMRGEPRRLLDRSSGAEREVRLRLMFDEPRHPDFELVLWPARAGRGAPTKPREAIAEANRWIARIEAVLRRTGGPLVRTEIATAQKARPARVHDQADLFEADEDAENEEAFEDEDQDLAI